MNAVKIESAWSAHHDEIIKIVSPEVAAEKLERTLAVVLARRRELGLPEYDSGKKQTPGGHLRPWTQQEDALVRKLPPSEVAKRIGRTLGAVMTRRTRLSKLAHGRD
jgi:hypothetical protein